VISCNRPDLIHAGGNKCVRRHDASVDDRSRQRCCVSSNDVCSHKPMIVTGTGKEYESPPSGLDRGGCEFAEDRREQFFLSTMFRSANRRPRYSPRAVRNGDDGRFERSVEMSEKSESEITMYWQIPIRMPNHPNVFRLGLCDLPNEQVNPGPDVQPTDVQSFAGTNFRARAASAGQPNDISPLSSG